MSARHESLVYAVAGTMRRTGARAIKIGYTRNIARRLLDLRAEHGLCEAQLLAVVSGDAAREHALQRLLAAHGHALDPSGGGLYRNGLHEPEWFRDTPAARQLIATALTAAPEAARVA